VANLRKDFLSLREYNRVQVMQCSAVQCSVVQYSAHYGQNQEPTQVGSIKHVLETMLMEISKVKNDSSEFVTKTEAMMKLLERQSLRLSTAISPKYCPSKIALQVRNPTCTSHFPTNQSRILTRL
jgi:hypothetical protein